MLLCSKYAASKPRRRCVRSWLLLKFGWLITGGSTALPRNAASEIDLFSKSGGSSSSVSVLLRAVVQVCRCAAPFVVAGGLELVASVRYANGSAAVGIHRNLLGAGMRARKTHRTPRLGSPHSSMKCSALAAYASQISQNTDAALLQRTSAARTRLLRETRLNQS